MHLLSRYGSVYCSGLRPALYGIGSTTIVVRVPSIPLSVKSKKELPDVGSSCQYSSMVSYHGVHVGRTIGLALTGDSGNE